MTLITHRLTAARRKVYIYIIVITCLLVLHFKLSQDFIRKPSAAPRCHSCLANAHLEGQPERLHDVTKTPPLNKNSSILADIRDVGETRDEIFSKVGNREGGEIRERDSLLNVRMKVTGSNLNRSRVLIEEPEDEEVAADTKRNGGPMSANVTGNALSRPKPLFVPPPNEKPVKRFPQCLIIGFGKCGTRALVDFLGLHPYVVHHGAEMHFYDKDEIFQNGFQWYRNEMPASYSNQITVEKTPAYIQEQRARDEIYKLTPNVKLLLLVRDPVVRLVSHFLLKYRDKLPYEHIPVTVIYRDKVTNKFMPDYKPVVHSIYYQHVAMWLERFPLKQFLILNSEDMTTNPYHVMKKVETFLGLPPMFEERNFYFNETSGFFCPRGFEEDAKPVCLGKTKGVKHPKLPSADEKMLYDFFRPYNEKFFQLVHHRFEWTERYWEHH